MLVQYDPNGMRVLAADCEVLANTNRLWVLAQVAAEPESNAQQLAQALESTVGGVNCHLTRLMALGLVISKHVRSERGAQVRHYVADPGRVQQIADAIALFAGALARKPDPQPEIPWAEWPPAQSA